MIRVSQISFILAIALHAYLLFGVVLPRTQHEPPAKEPIKEHIEVDLVEAAPPVEETPPPPPPEPPPEVVETPPPTPEPPKEIEQPPPPPAEPEPVRALAVTEPVTAAPPEAEFQVAATTTPPPPLTKVENVPLSPPVPEVPVVEPDAIVKAEARYRHNPHPHYPVQAKRRRQEGVVLLRVILDKEGLPTKVEVKESSKFELLDRAAVDAVRLWQFEPAMFGDQPMASEVEVPVRFSLTR